MIPGAVRSCLTAAVAVISAVLASPADAQNVPGAAAARTEENHYITAHPRIVEGEAGRPRGTFYVGGYAAPGWSARDVVQFYTLRDPADRSPEGVAYVSIPIASRLHEDQGGLGPRSWADGRTCPQIYGVMYEFSRLSPPMFHTPRLSDETRGSSRMGPVSLGIHAPVVSVWGYSRQADGVPMSMTLSGTDGIIARWVQWSEDQLASCWRDQQPELP